jgi:type II secretory pathway pseudopilin PulG
MVVMGIIAVLAVLGISAIININSANTVDRVTEEIVTAVRESQNMAISIASDPAGTQNPPLAWGIYLNVGNKSVQPFYLNSNEEYTPYGEVFTYNLLEIFNIKEGHSYYFFTTPFGKYYSTSNNPDTLTWNQNSQRPYDIIPAGVSSERSVLEFSTRNNSRGVVIEANGDVYAQ